MGLEKKEPPDFNRFCQELGEECVNHTAHDRDNNPFGINDIVVAKNSGEPSGPARIDTDIMRLFIELLQANESSPIHHIAEVLTKGAIVPTNYEPIVNIVRRHIMLMQASQALANQDPEFLSIYQKLHTDTSFWQSKALPVEFVTAAHKVYNPNHPFALLYADGREKSILSIVRKMIAKSPRDVIQVLYILHNYINAPENEKSEFYPHLENCRQKFREEVSDIIAITYVTRCYSQSQMQHASDPTSSHYTSYQRLTELENEMLSHNSNRNACTSIALYTETDSTLFNNTLELIQKTHLCNIHLITQKLQNYASTSAQKTIITDHTVPLLQMVAFIQRGEYIDVDQFNQLYTNLLIACNSEALFKTLQDREVVQQLLPVEWMFYYRIYLFKKAGYKIDRITDNYAFPKKPLNLDDGAKYLNCNCGFTGFQIKYTNAFSGKPSEVQIKDAISWLNANHPLGVANHDQYKRRSHEELRPKLQQIEEGVLERLRAAEELAKQTFTQNPIPK